MGIKLIMAPTVEPVTLSDAKAQLGISDEIQDHVIARNIVAARQYAENYTRCAIINQTWEMALDYFPSRIYLPHRPVQSITSVKYIDVDGIEQTMSSALYTLDDYSDPVSILRADEDDEWPDTDIAKNVVKVRYVAGFGATDDAVPAQIREAILLTVGHWINYRPQAELGVSVTMVPRAVDQLLSPYRIHLV